MSYTGPGIVGNNEYLAAEPYVLHMREAAEDIGILSDAESGTRHPENPHRAFGIPLIVDNPSGTDHVYKHIPVKQAGKVLADVVGFCGVNNSTAYESEEVSVRNRGDVFLKVGSASIVAGELAILDIDSTENSDGAVAGDIIPFDTANDGYSTGSAGDLADITSRLSALVGRSYSSVSARTGTGDGQWDIAKVRMRGF